MSPNTIEIRIKEIIRIATKLGWIKENPNKSEYPLMQLSEVEKCMYAMVSNLELERMREWEKDPNKPLDILKDYNKKREEELSATIKTQLEPPERRY